jgi:NAD(P)-dependent dehydrogenase (short-subunit alcohol dehydrogenase family)
LGNCIADALCNVNLQALVIFDVLKEHGDQAVAVKYGVPVVFHQVDVLNQSSVQDAVDATIQQFGKIDGLVTSAGISQ